MPEAVAKPVSSFSAPAGDTRRGAQRAANRKIGLIGHALVYALGCLLVFVVAGSLVGTIVLIGWTIALVCHGFFGVVAPKLRKTWVDQELAGAKSEAAEERAVTESRHSRAMAELSASIAHEIRNPITAAKSLAQQIAESPTAAENAEYAAVVVSELDRVERSIAHLLRFAREEPRRTSRIRLSEPVVAALDLLADRLAQAGVAVDRDLAKAGSVEGDVEQLRRVFANVVGNAIDAMTEARVARPRLEIRAGENLAGTEAWVTIADNGPGITPEAKDRIFAPFYTDKKGGTGLGLALCRKVVEEHRGTISVESEPGQGARFVITLPASSTRDERS
jgi:signal transduction histidine kinase